MVGENNIYNTKIKKAFSRPHVTHFVKYTHFSLFINKSLNHSVKLERIIESHTDFSCSTVVVLTIVDSNLSPVAKFLLKSGSSTN